MLLSNGENPAGLYIPVVFIMPFKLLVLLSVLLLLFAVPLAFVAFRFNIPAKGVMPEDTFCNNPPIVGENPKGENPGGVNPVK